MRRLIACALALAAIIPATAKAQQASSRDGFWISIGLGGGSLGCEGCSGRETGFSGQLQLGGTINSHVSLGVSSNAWTKSESGATLTMSSLTAAVRYYPSATGNFFILGGLGVATLSAGVSGFGSGSTSGTGALLGIGYDIRVGNSVSLTPYLNGIGGSFDGGNANFSQIGLAVTWP